MGDEIADGDGSPRISVILSGPVGETGEAVYDVALGTSAWAAAIAGAEGTMAS